MLGSDVLALSPSSSLARVWAEYRKDARRRARDKRPKQTSEADARANPPTTEDDDEDDNYDDDDDNNNNEVK